MSVKIVEEARNYRKLQEALKFIEKNNVYIGIQQKDSSREDDPTVTNAELLFIHTNGSPVNNIPPRPVIEPAIEDDAERLGNMMDKAFEFVKKGDREAALKQLKLVGMRGQNISRAWFTNPNNGWAPNSPSTRMSKILKYKKSHRGNASGYEPRPLIDTGELRKSITYFVETDGRKVR